MLVHCQVVQPQVSSLWELKLKYFLAFELNLPSCRILALEKFTRETLAASNKCINSSRQKKVSTGPTLKKSFFVLPSKDLTKNIKENTSGLFFSLIILFRIHLSSISRRVWSWCRRNKYSSRRRRREIKFRQILTSAESQKRNSRRHLVSKKEKTSFSNYFGRKFNSKACLCFYKTCARQQIYSFFSFSLLFWKKLVVEV